MARSSCVPAATLERPHRPLRGRMSRRTFRRLFHERLENRTLLASATLSISNGALNYQASSGVPNVLTVSLAPAAGTVPATYTITDTGESIALGSGTKGWTSSGNMVTGPSSTVTSIAINTLDGNDSVTIVSVGAPTAIAFTGNPGNADTVTLGGKTNGVQSIAANVTITNAAGTTSLTLNDSSDTSAKTVFLSDGEIANLVPFPIQFGAANLSSLTIMGAGALGTLNVNANDQGPVAVTAGLTTGSGTITIGTNAPINYTSFLAVNVSNAADQPLTQVSQTITTSTSDVPTEGKAFTFLATTFADDDLQAKTSGFVASIDWGDGTAPVAGSISADGAGQFQVSGSHTYQEAGTYPVVVTITDLGATDTLSIAGIAVTISDLGGAGLTTGSVAQVNLVSNSSSIPAPITDPKLVNPWGIAGDANGFAWVANEGSGVATYEGPGGPTPEGTSVVIPAANGIATGSPTGIVFNATSAFAIKDSPSLFLYATLDGTISGWNGVLTGTPKAVIAVNNASAGAIYTGLAIANDGGQPLIYAANFHTAQIEVYNSTFQVMPGFKGFTDPNWPNGYSPYNIQNIGGNLYVTFAKQNQARTAPVPGLGNGFVDEFTPAGVLIQRLITGAPLDAPWGLAIAPAAFSQYSNDLLVANSGDGEVDAFDPATNLFLGVFADDTGAPISNDGLHGLLVGVGQSLYFTSGPASGTEGLFGTLTPAPDTVTVLPATLTASITNVAAFVNQPFDGVVATFTDANIYALPTDFTATVEWGDGSSDTSGDGNVTIVHTDGIGSSFLVQGTHTYTTATTGDPPYILTITITDTAASNSVFAQGTASVSEPTLHVTVGGITAVVNEPYLGSVATFTDDAPDPNLADYSAIIHWGDGSSTTGKITLANQAGQGFIITDAGSSGVLHQYSTATTGQDPFVITVTVTKTAHDTLGNPVNESGVAIGNVTVNLPTLHATMTAIPAVAGTLYSSQVASFTDDDPVPALENNSDPDPNLFYTAVIEWGDGTETFGDILQSTSAAAAFIVTGNHTYAVPTVGASPFVASVLIVKTATDETSGAAENVTVADSLLFPFRENVALGVTEGAIFSGPVGQFTDNNPFVTPANFNGPNASQTTINWGDGKTSVGTITLVGSVFTVSGTHVYASPTPAGIPNTVLIAVTDQWGGKTTITNNMTVGAAALTFTNLSLPLNPGVPIVAGKPFTSDVSLFTSANPNATAGEYTASITWGDNTPVDLGTIKEDGTGIFHVTGTHTYSTAGNFTINIAILVVGGTIFLDPITADVSDASIQYTPPNAPVTKDVKGNNVAPGKPFTFTLGTLNDTDPNSSPGDFIPTIFNVPTGTLVQGISINWGDGSPLDTAGGTLTPTAAPGQNYAVTGTHTYDTADNFLVTVTITDFDGSTTTNTLAIDVAPAAAAAPGVLGVFARALGLGSFLVAGQSFTDLVATFTTTTSTATASNFAASIDWGDGDDSPGTIVQGANESDTSELFYVFGTHVYDAAGVYDFSVSVSTPGNAPLSDDDTATVGGAPLIGHSAPISGVQGTALPDSTVVATFVYTGPVPDPATFAGNTDVTVDWGDSSGNDTVVPIFVGSTPAGTTFVVEDGHDYKNITDVFQAFQVTVTIVSSTEGSATVVTDLALMNVPVLTDPPIAVRAVAGNAFTVPVATIHTTNAQTSAGDFTSNIQWGDGQNSSAVLQSEGGGTFEVFGSHSYATPGTFPIAISLTDNQGNTVTDTSSATVIAPPSPALATVASVQTYTGSRHLVSQIRVTFDSPVDATAAANPSLYRLLRAGKKGSFTGRGIQAIRVRSAVYDATDDAVLLTVRTPFSLSKPVQLAVGGQPRSILKAAQGQITAAVTSSRPERVDVAAKPAVAAAGNRSDLRQAGGHRANHAGQVDVLLERNKLADVKQLIRARRRANPSP